MTIGMRVSLSGWMRGLPAETEIESEALPEADCETIIPLRKSFCGTTVIPPRTLRFLYAMFPVLTVVVVTLTL